MNTKPPQIAHTSLFTVTDLEEKATGPDGSRTTMSVANFVNMVEEKKRQRLTELAKEYASMTPLLLKVEEEVAGTNSGASPPMAAYYSYWEAKMFNCVAAMVVRSLATMLAILKSEMVGGGLIIITAAFSGGDLQVTPSLTHVLKTMTALTRGLVESGRMFPRWMYDHSAGCGTCLVAPPVVISEFEDPVVTSFYDEVIKSPAVIKLMLAINHEVHLTSAAADRWLDTWRLFDSKEQLWTSKRKATLDKARKAAPSVVFYDAKLAKYSSMHDDAATRPTYVECSFLRVDGRALAQEVCDMALVWKADYSQLLHDSSRSLLDATQQKLARQRAECLGTETADLEALKKVLNAIAFIEAEQMDVELSYRQVIFLFANVATNALCL